MKVTKIRNIVKKVDTISRLHVVKKFRLTFVSDICERIKCLREKEALQTYPTEHQR